MDFEKHSLARQSHEDMQLADIDEISELRNLFEPFSIDLTTPEFFSQCHGIKKCEFDADLFADFDDDENETEVKLWGSCWFDSAQYGSYEINLNITEWLNRDVMPELTVETSYHFAVLEDRIIAANISRATHDAKYATMPEPHDLTSVELEELLTRLDSYVNQYENLPPCEDD